MNVFRIALLVFLVQEVILIASVASIPLACNSAQTNCVYFNVSTISSTTMADLMQTEIEEDEYKSTQIASDIEQDESLDIGKAINIAKELIYGHVFGLKSIITFIFGNGAVATAIGSLFQAIVYFFYSILLLNIVRFAGGKI